MSELTDGYGDRQIASWKEHMAIYYPDLSADEADEFIEEARGPAWELAASLGRDTMEVAIAITRAIHG